MRLPVVLFPRFRACALATSALLACAVAGACQSSSTPSGTPVAGPDFCGQVAELVCEADRACCTQPGSVDIEPPATPDGGVPAPDGGSTAPDGGAPQGPDCVTTQRDACRASLGALILDPRTGYDPERAGALVERLRASAETCWATAPSYDDFREAFAGTGKPGADCTPAGTAASELQLSALSCQRGTTCHLYLRADGARMGVCEPLDADAASCSHAHDCPAGAWCNLPAEWRPGVWGECQPLRADGWSCGSDLECASGYCDARRVCAPPPAGRFCATVGYADAVLLDRPIAYWRLAESPGATVLDATGNGHDGAFVGAAAHVAPGAVAGDGAGAAQFDGATAHVAIPAASTLDTALALSLECWFKPTDVAAARPILEYGDGTATGPHLWSHPAGDQLMVNFRDTEGGSHSIETAAAAVAAATWHHAVATYDGTTGRLFLDGTQVGEVTGTFLLATDGPFQVGFRPGGTTAFLGAIDEVAVYDYALPAARVQAHKRVGDTGPVAGEWAPFAWFR